MAAQDATARFEFVLENNDETEQQTKKQLLRLLSAHDISNWIFTYKIKITSDRRTIPHSHPILTLNTRYLKDDELLLATFLHEQIHWYIDSKKERLAADREIRAMFPNIPVGFPQGANDEVSSYFHIQVCFLEYVAIEKLYGELKAKQVIDFWKSDHYTWIYKTVLERKWDIYAVMRKNNLIPTSGKSK